MEAAGWRLQDGGMMEAGQPAYLLLYEPAALGGTCAWRLRAQGAALVRGGWAAMEPVRGGCAGGWAAMLPLSHHGTSWSTSSRRSRRPAGGGGRGGGVQAFKGGNDGGTEVRAKAGPQWQRGGTGPSEPTTRMRSESEPALGNNTHWRVRLGG
jgi:hypothetical protein